MGTRGDRVEVQLDLFPAKATVASTTFDNVRAVIASGQLQLFTLTAGGVSVIYDKAVLTSPEGSISSGITVTTEDGTIWIEQSGGCGCGSQLKIADLFPGRRRVHIPLHA